MSSHVIFGAPFFMDATLRFIEGASRLPGVDLSIISQDPAERVPDSLRGRIAGHWRVDDALDPEKIVHAARKLSETLGPPCALFGALEQMQVPLAIARQSLGIGGLGVEAALNFRDKARMKTVLRAAGVPCARHALIGGRDAAVDFAQERGYPLVVKPPAGAGGKSTFRLDDGADLDAFLTRFPPSAEHPTLCEEFISGTEYSFDSVMVDGKLVWHSISRYMPSPLEVLENAWIQWCVLLPREIDQPEFDPIREYAEKGLSALGLETGLSHMEWFRLADGRIAISEVGARPPGAQITSLLSYTHDIDFYRAWPSLMAFGRFEPPPRQFAAGAAYIRGQGRGRVKRIAGLGEAQRRFGPIVVEAKLPGEGQPPSDSYEGDGFIILRHPETSVVQDALSEIVKIIRVELE